MPSRAWRLGIFGTKERQVAVSAGTTDSEGIGSHLGPKKEIGAPS